MYKNKKILLTNTFYLFFCLSFTAYGANTVVIPDVNLKSQNVISQKQDTYIATTQFSKQDIKKSPVINLSQFLKQEQSVVRLANNSGDATQTALSLRGFGDNAAANSLILVDGFPLTNPSLLAPNFNSIPLSDIERIDILQGSQGTLWGNQAVGGVVNIITKHPKKFFTSGMVSLGSYNRYYTNILLGDKAQNGLFYKVFGLIGKTDNYRNHNQQYSNNLAAQFGWDYPHGTISIYTQSYGDQVYFPGGLSEEQFDKHPRQATDFKNNSRYRTNVLQLLNKQELSNQWLLETRIQYHKTDGDGFVFVHFDRNDSSTSINPRLIGTIYNNQIIVGYYGEISHYELINQKIQSQSSAKEHDLYFQTTIPVHHDFDFILGARKAWQSNRIEAELGEPFHALNQVFVTEQGVSYHPSRELSFFIRRDGNFSFPKANEETWVPDNVHALQVQTGTSYEAGTEWRTDKYLSQLSIYRLQLRDEIAFNPTQTLEQPFGAFNNLDDTLRKGISLSQLYHVTSRATINGQLNYVNARFASGMFAGKLIPAVPAFNGNVGLNYDWTEHWATQYTLLYTSSRFASEDVANTGKKISGYWLNNIALQYFIRFFSVNFEIQNLFNKQYPAYVFYNAFTNKNTYYPAAGRNYALTFKMNLD